MINSDNYSIIYQFKTKVEFTESYESGVLDPIQDCTLVIIDDTKEKLLYYLGGFRVYYINICLSLNKINKPQKGSFYYSKSVKRIFYFDGNEFHEACNNDTKEDPCICPKGDPGIPGSSGSSGTSGTSGFIGPEGPPGPPGAPGTSGTSGAGGSNITIEETCLVYTFIGKTYVGTNSSSSNDPTYTGSNSQTIPHPPSPTLLDIWESDTETHIRANVLTLNGTNNLQFFNEKVVPNTGIVIKITDLLNNEYIYSSISSVVVDDYYLDITVNTISETGILNIGHTELCMTIQSIVSIASKTFSFFIS